MPQTHNEATGSIFPQMHIEASGTIFAHRFCFGHKNALAEARARIERCGFYWTADATLCNSAVFSVCLVKTM